MNSFYKKIISFILVLSFVMPFALSRPKTAEASLLTFDGANAIQNTISAIADVASQISVYYNEYKESVLDGLAYMAAKAIIRQLTSDLVDWINGGFEGSPRFIDNPEGFFVDIADNAIGAFIEGDPPGSSPLAFLCKPGIIDIRLSLLFNYSPFHKRASCTLSDVVKNVQGTIEGFTQGDFAQGGWDGWASLTTQPQNNVYGAKIMAQNELMVRIGNKTLINERNANWGRGFMSWEKCTDNEDSYHAKLEAEKVKDDEESYYVATQTYKKLRDCKVQTPGSVIESQINQALPTGLRQLELADEINEIVSALIAQLMKQALGGAGGLSGASSGGANSYTDQLRGEIDVNASLVAKAVQGMAQSIATENELLGSKKAIVSEVENTGRKYIEARQCYEEKLRKTPPLLPDQKAEVQSKINSINTTLQTRIDPKVRDAKSQADAVQALIARLQGIQARMQSATLSVASAAATEYQNMVLNRELHTAIDTQNARTNLEDTRLEFAPLNQTADQELSSCRAL